MEAENKVPEENKTGDSQMENQEATTPEQQAALDESMKLAQ